MSGYAAGPRVTRPPRDVVFEELPVPIKMSLWHTNNGGKNLRRFVAKHGNEFIRVMSAQEPVGVGKSLEGHVSVTIAESDSHGAPPSDIATENEQGWG